MKNHQKNRSLLDPIHQSKLIAEVQNSTNWKLQMEVYVTYYTIMNNNKIY